MTKQEKKQKKIDTNNHIITVKKHETSYQGLLSKFQNGEDGVYNMIIANDKNIILTPKKQITAEDLEQFPALKQVKKAIELVQKDFEKATGKKRYLLKKQLIELQQDQYVIKNSFRRPSYCVNAVKNFHALDLSDHIQVSKTGEIQDKTLFSLMNPIHVSAILCNYSRLKEDLYDKHYTDGYYLVWDLENLIDKYLKEQYPLYYTIIIYKIDKCTNLEIQKKLKEDFQVQHSIEYISALWRKKIPKIIAEAAQKQYLTWYFTMKKPGQWKKCSRCKEIKLAHNYFFSKNSSSKDGFYSICKQCRNKKNKKKINSKNKIIKHISYQKYCFMKAQEQKWRKH